MEPASTRYREWLGWGLWLAAFLLYLPASQFKFVNYDDFVIVFERAQVFSGLSLNNLIWAFSTLHSDFAYWMPLTWLSHQFDCHFFGHNAGAHHLTNVFLHSFNTFLLFSVLHRITNRVWRSALVALLFAWHPLHVETVAWVAERKSLVCSLFWMLTLHAYLRFAAKRTLLNYLGVLVCCFGAFMGKPMAVTLPFSLLLLDIWPLNRLQTIAQSKGALWRAWSRLAAEKIPLFVMSAVGSFMAFLAQKQIGAVREEVDFLFRAQNAVAAYWVYIRKTFWPHDLMAIYERTPWPAGVVIWAAIFLVAVSILCFRLRRSRPYLIVGWLWYLGNLVPSIGIIQIGAHSMADRYTYIPLIGVFIIVVWGIADLLAKFQLGSSAGEAISSSQQPRTAKRLSGAVTTRIAGACALSVCLLVALCARRQIAVWSDGVALFTRAVKVAPTSAKARFLLGMNHLSSDNPDEAIAEANQSLRLDPTKAPTYSLLGAALVKRGKFAEAKRAYEKALEIDPNEKKALGDLARLLARPEQTEPHDPVSAMRYAARLCQLSNDWYPGNSSLLAAAFASAGRLTDAIRIAQEGLEIAMDTKDRRWAPILQKQLKKYRDRMVAVSFANHSGLPPASGNETNAKSASK